MTQCHNEVRDAIDDLATLAWGQVKREPVVCDATSDPSGSETLIADLRIRGMWQHQVDAIFDVCVVDTDAPSYRCRSPQAMLQSAEGEKKQNIVRRV